MERSNNSELPRVSLAVIKTVCERSVTNVLQIPTSEVVKPRSRCASDVTNVVKSWMTIEIHGNPDRKVALILMIVRKHRRRSVGGDSGIAKMAPDRAAIPLARRERYL